MTRYLESSPFSFGYTQVKDRNWYRTFGRKEKVFCKGCSKDTEHYAAGDMLFCATCERPFDELPSKAQHS